MGRFTPSRQLLLHALLNHRQPELSLRGTGPNVGASTSRLPPPKKLRKVMSSGVRLLMQQTCEMQPLELALSTIQQFSCASAGNPC